MIRLKDDEFLYIVEYMRRKYGINLDNKRVLIECRMTKELESRDIKSYAHYMELLKRDRSGELAGILVNRLTTNYTYFFREPEHFKFLRDKILPELFQNNSIGLCNIWCAGCATGEEYYTFAMMLQDYSQGKSNMPHIRIKATDICAEALEIAEKGIYPVRELDSLPLEWQKKYCHLVDKKSFCVDNALKANVGFFLENLMDSVVERGKYHVVLCRNVMIYFDRASREKLVKKLEESLKPGGYLLIGHAELLSKDETILESVYPAVYKKQGNV